MSDSQTGTGAPRTGAGGPPADADVSPAGASRSPADADVSPTSASRSPADAGASPTSDRAAARVVCVDGDGRVLLMHWRDTVTGVTLWEPPGGGIDPGETPFEAARRELTEETGLPGEAVLDRWVPVRREFDWLGTHYVKTERFYLARFEGTPVVGPGAFTAEENETYLGSGWFSPAEMAGLPDALEPPELVEVVSRITRLG
ncbi:NUDIX hydrolase [Streptosporangium roseum]|uniref:NUDIX hydrolase n=1 Tax=Streptosporangium roseum TaxID=2001 RepID=UPI0009DD3D4D|nr:NUDIX domain-containing protein [Streptosporangium roseum]